MLEIAAMWNIGRWGNSEHVLQLWLGQATMPQYRIRGDQLKAEHRPPHEEVHY